MKNAIWGYAVIALGILAIVFIFFFANVTNTDQHNYNLLKETVEASMYDALDLAEYRTNGTIQIDEDKFVENFLRRFAENASLRDSYQIEIYDISEKPPKVSLKVYTYRGGSTSITGDTVEFKADIVNTIDAILETTYTAEVLQEYTQSEEVIEKNEEQICTYHYDDKFNIGTITTVCARNQYCEGSKSVNLSGKSCYASNSNCYLAGNGTYVNCITQTAQTIDVTMICDWQVEGPC